MAAIRSAGTSPEVALRALMRKTGLRLTVNAESLPGTPDVVFPSRKLVVELFGCFWHGCKKHYKLPAVNRAYWVAKADRNRRRDQRVERQLHRLGWSVVRIWECDLETAPERCLRRVERLLAKGAR
jgi:DNA mismatch endonuclease (patch repair protein)